MIPTSRKQLDQTLARLSKQEGKLVYGVLWDAGRPALVAHDTAADLGIRA